MTNDIRIFENESFGKIRVVDMDGQPWFVGKDVAEVLGYSNTKDAIVLHVDKEDKTVFLRSENTTLEIPNRGLTIINESGLYSLMLSSKLPKAKDFKRWVTSQVLPSIRKYGAYITDELLQKIESDENVIHELLEKLNSEQRQKEALADYIEGTVHKVRYHDVILQCKNVLQTSIIAKDYGMSCVSFNKLLAELKIQFRVEDSWLLYQPYATKGYTISKTYHVSDKKVSVHSYWTQKGRKFLYETLCKHGIYPLCEREEI